VAEVNPAGPKGQIQTLFKQGTPVVRRDGALMTPGHIIGVAANFRITPENNFRITPEGFFRIVML
jgi:hypothetical protein